MSSTTIFSLIAAIAAAVGIAVLFGLNANDISQGIMNILSPKQDIRTSVKMSRGNKKRKGLYWSLTHYRKSLNSTGRAGMFAIIIVASILMACGGVALCIVLNNLFLAPSMALGLGLLPFLYGAINVRKWDKRQDMELETALSIITTSYVRSEDIISAITENLEYIKPPLRGVFESFIGDTNSIEFNMRKAIYNMSAKVENSIFDEWCETLVQCQTDRTMKDTLMPIVNKLTDIRIVNEEINLTVGPARIEYYTMLGMLFGIIPLLKVINDDWFHTLIFTTYGKVIQGVDLMVIVLTAIGVYRATKPLEYEG